MIMSSSAEILFMVRTVSARVKASTNATILGIPVQQNTKYNIPNTMLPR